MLENVPIGNRASGETGAGPVHAFEGVVAKIGQNGHVRANDWANPSLRLRYELIFVVVVAHRPKIGLGEVPDFMALGGALSRDQVGLVVAVQMNLEVLCSK